MRRAAASRSKGRGNQMRLALDFISLERAARNKLYTSAYTRACSIKTRVARSGVRRDAIRFPPRALIMHARALFFHTHREAPNACGDGEKGSCASVVWRLSPRHTRNVACAI